MLIIIKNTYPKHPNVAYGEIGDIVRWELYRGCFHLMRIKDNVSVFVSAPVNGMGLLRSNKKQPKLIGTIAQVKSKNWELIIKITGDT